MIPGLAKNAVVAASAGTGKTELLTSIYLGHCLGLHAGSGCVSPTRIVATTFSRAAAREIRERLEKRLAGVAGSEVAEHERRLGTGLATLATEQGVSRAELQRRAARALDELPDAAIDTLHNLCGRILREHGLELDISPSFTILEEQRSVEDTEQAIDEVLSEALLAPGLPALGAQQLLDASGGLDRLRGWMLALLARLDDEGLEATSLERGDEGAAAKRVRNLLYETCRELVTEPESAKASHARRVLEALRGVENGGSPAPLSAALVDLATERKGKKGAPGTEALKLLLERSGGQNNTLRARGLVRLIVEGPTLDARLEGVGLVIADIQRRLRERHVAQHALGFGDLLRLTRDGLRDHPEVARAAGARIELLLVDEFQDTSRVQCELLLLLRERPEQNQRRRPGALPVAADLRPRGLVVVGDRKQSIYGFRGADVSVFAELATALSGNEAARLLDLPKSALQEDEGPVMAEVSTLVESYRSAPAIVEAVNLISARDFSPRLERSYEIRYAAAEALRVPHSRKDGAPGTFTLLLDDSLTPEAEPLIANAQGGMRAALAIAGFCATAAREGRPLGSLALLARRRATLPLLGFALDHFNVPYVVAGRDLYGTPEVRDVVAALRLCQAPRDRHALAVLARSPLGGLSDQALLELSDPRRGLLPVGEWDPARLSLTADQTLAALLKERLESYLLVAARLSPRDAIWELVERFELTRIFALLPRGAVRLANVGRLQEIAATHGGNLAAFVRFVNRQIELETDETEAAVFSVDDDAVRLLTIHASKGLAFPTVIVADAEAVERPQPAPVGILRRAHRTPLLVVRHVGDGGPIITDTQKELSEDASARAQAERQRLSYVALTRAQHELVLALPARANGGSLARTVLDLHTEGAFSGLLGFRELSVSQLLAAPKLQATDGGPSSDPPPRPARAASTAVVLGVTALSDFRICPRRFSLLQLQGLPEPRQSQRQTRPDPASEIDPRAAGIAAHHVLEVWPLDRWGEPPDPAFLAAALAQGGLPPESEIGQKTLAGLSRFLGGSYAARVRREAVRVEREVELTVTLSAPTPQPGPARARASRHNPAQLELFAPASPSRALPLAPGPPLIVKATLDLLVELGDGSLHVIDYKRTRGGGGDHARYGPQLALYRSVVEHALGKTPRVGLLHLLGDTAEPHWLSPPSVDPLDVAKAFLDARAQDRWERVAESTCRAVHCGFVTSCYAHADFRKTT